MCAMSVCVCAKENTRYRRRSKKSASIEIVTSNIDLAAFYTVERSPLALPYWRSLLRHSIKQGPNTNSSATLENNLKNMKGGLKMP
jgi:hypothetical protein